MKGHCKGVQQLPHWVYPVRSAGSGVVSHKSFAARLSTCAPKMAGWVVLSCILLSPKVTCWCSRCNKECCIFMNLFMPLYHVYIWYIYNHLNCEPSHVQEPVFPKSKNNLSEVSLKVPRLTILPTSVLGHHPAYYQRPEHLSAEARAV